MTRQCVWRLATPDEPRCPKTAVGEAELRPGLGRRDSCEEHCEKARILRGRVWLFPGTRVALVSLPKLADEFRGLHGTVIEPPSGQAEASEQAKWTWVRLDGVVTPRYFYAHELRFLDLVERVGELSISPVTA